MHKYVGRYDRRIVTFQNGKLMYQAREGSEPAELIPINETTFRFEDVDYFRIQFVIKDGAVVGLKGLFDNGEADYSKRL